MYTYPDAGPASTTEVENPPGQMTSNAAGTFGNVASLATGVVYAGSLIKMADIRDGTSHTYLAGEKYLGPDCYDTGTDPGDNEDSMMGDNADISRWAGLQYPPYPDTPGLSYWQSFGSAHANGFQVAYCDGSVDMISYAIDLQVHGWLANRADGHAIAGNKL